MNRQMSYPTRQEVLTALRERYLDASRAEKSKILDEFVGLTGTHRKHAIRVLRKKSVVNQKSETQPGRRVYDDAVGEALVVVWEAADRICGKRLHAILPQFVDSMERHGHFKLEPTVKEKLLNASAATLDRLLRPKREKIRRPRKRAKPKASQEVKIKTFSDWHDPQPGFLEIDFVVHAGGNNSGEKIHSLVVTDVCSGWTEAVPLLAREQSLVVAGLEVLAKQLPMPIQGIDSDNDSAFINDTLVEYCKNNRLEFTRSRPYRSNDQAWIEQKNGAVIRRFVGYERFSGPVAGQALASLYQSARLYVNFFQPSFKLLSKQREGAQFKRKFSKPRTPCDRLLAHPDISSTSKEQLSATKEKLDPIELLCRIRECQSALAALQKNSCEGPERKSLSEFLEALPKLWKEGEVRPTHQAKPTPKRTWRTRHDPFEDDWPMILEWLESAPDATAKCLLARLLKENPDKYHQGQLRTLQRRVKQWRQLMAKKLVYDCLPDEFEAAAVSNGAKPGGQPPDPRNF